VEKTSDFQQAARLRQRGAVCSVVDTSSWCYGRIVYMYINIMQDVAKCSSACDADMRGPMCN
jgi:hypothetical protein